jgi:hypothetical protein
VLRKVDSKKIVLQGGCDPVEKLDLISDRDPGIRVFDLNGSQAGILQQRIDVEPRPERRLRSSTGHCLFACAATHSLLHDK